MLLFVALTNSIVIKLRVCTFVFDNELNLGMKILLLFYFGDVLATIKRHPPQLIVVERELKLWLPTTPYLK
jgi:hypothetical protein